MSDKNQKLADFIWSVADLLRGDYKRSEYRKVILPMTVLRRMDCVMSDMRGDVWAREESYAGVNKDAVLRVAAGRNYERNIPQAASATTGLHTRHRRRPERDRHSGAGRRAHRRTGPYRPDDRGPVPLP